MLCISSGHNMGDESVEQGINAVTKGFRRGYKRVTELMTNDQRRMTN